MLLEYIQSAMKRAHYEILPDGEGYYGKIPQFKGVWANADTLEECRSELQEVLDEWVVISLKNGNEIPVINGIDLDFKKDAA